MKYEFCEGLKLPSINEKTLNLFEQLRNAKSLSGFHLYFMKFIEMTSEKRQIAAN